MAANSKIEWTNHTFNPWIGCTKVSPGCANCYAETEDKRRGWTPDGWGPGKPRHRTSERNWDKVRAWDAQAKNASDRPRIFCASLADWLDDEVPINWLADLLLLIDETPNLDWLLLTKRPENFKSRMQAIFDSGMADCRVIVPDLWLNHHRPPDNVWFGVSTEDQKRADERIPVLMNIPARLRWLSVEPLLGPLDLQGIGGRHIAQDILRGQQHVFRGIWPGPKIDWVVVGGESGTYANPCHPDWIRRLRDQCVEHGVPFFFKQWGEFSPNGERDASSGFRLPRETVFGDGQSMIRVGKKEAGLLLDGIEWKQFPEVSIS